MSRATHKSKVKLASGEKSLRLALFSWNDLVPFPPPQFLFLDLFSNVQKGDALSRHHLAEQHELKTPISLRV